MFKAIVIDKNSDTYLANLTELDDAQLPEGDVTVRVAFSTLNYKDALAFGDYRPESSSASLPYGAWHRLGRYR